jgi:hypothetical protein
MKDLQESPERDNQDDAQARIWETNHAKILEFISETIKWAGSTIPTVTEISKGTGLSRKAIYNHLKNVSLNPAGQQRLEMLDAFEGEIMMKICKLAMYGNLQAAKLYLELRGKIQPKGFTINSQTNNVQINGITLNQQVLQNLSAEQLKTIEEILKSVNGVTRGNRFDGVTEANNSDNQQDNISK